MLYNQNESNKLNENMNPIFKDTLLEKFVEKSRNKIRSAKNDLELLKIVARIDTQFYSYRFRIIRELLRTLEEKRFENISLQQKIDQLESKFS